MTAFPSENCYIIAEIGVNHNGEYDIARELVEEADSAGVDAVKFQTFTAEELVTPETQKAEYQTREDAETQYSMLKKYELKESEYKQLCSLSHDLGLDFISTPYDPKSVDLLSEIDVDAYKIASADLINKLLITAAAAEPEPLILSTGMATLGEIERTMEWLETIEKDETCLLHCVSCYPTEPEDVNMAFMETLRTAFDGPVGFSDHTLGTEIATMAASLGADVIEKHFTLDQSMEGPDHFASIEPDGLSTLVENVNRVEKARGSTVRQIPESEAKNIDKMRRSLHAKRDLSPGTELTAEDIEIVRPFSGIEPGAIDEVIGGELTTKIDKHNPIQWHHIR
jgi:sialic acid synthase SpsE